MRYNLTQLKARLPIILPRRDSQMSQWSLYRSLLEDAIMDNDMVRSRFVQIGVWCLQWLTIANAIGARQTSVSLTLAMPRGRWLRTHHFQQDLSKSRFHSFPTPELPSPSKPELKPLPWWHYLTRG